MNKFFNSFKKSNAMFLNKNLVNSDLAKQENAIQFLKKYIFTPDVSTELKIILNLISSTEALDIRNDVIKKVVTELLTMLSSSEKTDFKIDAFNYVFQAFLETTKTDDYLHIMQFFAFLCYLLGTECLKISEDSDKNTGIGLNVNDETFKSAFQVEKPLWSSSSLLILKGLFSFLTKISIPFDTPEIQPYQKWLLLLIKNLTLLSYGQNTVIEIFYIILNIDVRLIENNLEHILCNLVFKCNLKSSHDFFSSYSEFLKKTIEIFSNHQRIVKFFNRFLPPLKGAPKKFNLDNIFPFKAMEEFERTLTVISNQQLLNLFNLLILQLKDNLCGFLETGKVFSKVSIEVVSCLLIAILKEIKVYSPSISNKTIDAFKSEINFLKEIIKSLSNCILNSPELMMKNKVLLKAYLELSFHCTEIEFLMLCYEGTESAAPAWNEWTSFNPDDWDSLVQNYFNDNFQICQPVFFQISVQEIRRLGLGKINRQLLDSTKNIILNQFEESHEGLDFLNYLNPEDLTLLNEILPIKESRKLMKKFLNHILKREDEEKILKWLSDGSLLDNNNFIKNLFMALIGTTKNSVSKVKNWKMEFLSEDYFDLANQVRKEQLERIPGIINCLLEKHEKVTKIISQSQIFAEFQFKKVIEVFIMLPLMHMDNEIKKLGLAFTVQLAILTSTSNVESEFRILLGKLNDFLSCDCEVTSFCFDFGLFFKWLNHLDCGEVGEVNLLRRKIFEKLVKICSAHETGIKILDSMIQSRFSSTETCPKFQALETQVSIYEEISKQVSKKGRKRKSEGGNLESCRNKLAKILLKELEELQEKVSLTDKNYKILLKLTIIEWGKNEKENIKGFQPLKFQQYLDFAINKLQSEYDETCVRYLIKLVEMMASFRELVPNDSIHKIWSALKCHKSIDWKIFDSNSIDSEFECILSDLLKSTKDSLINEPSSNSTSFDCNYFEIWKVFLESNIEKRRNQSQIHLQNLFCFIRDCRTLLREKVSLKTKNQLVNFFCYCLSSKKLIMTNPMIDTILDVMLEWFDNDPAINNKDFHGLFVKQIEAGNSLLLKHFVWNKSKIHLTFVLFKRLVEDLTRRSDSSLNLSAEDVFFLSACAFSLEKWIRQTNTMKKDFARITPYFISVIISCMTSVTVFPPIKIHLVNCLNSLLSISDSHTVSYLMRALKPGHQQVFITVYNQFKKYHKYTGKI